MTLAADARLCSPDYCDDQIWELSLGGGEPSALALHTTYGLRARSLRLFPRFIEADTTRSDPLEFVNQPVIRHFYPNFLVVTYSPLPDIDVITEYWVPESKAIAGRLKIYNRSSAPRQVRLEWVALLTPNEIGQRMAPMEIQAVQVLIGQSGGLAPVIFLTGGPIAAAGPYPALTLGLDLSSGAARQLIWCHAGLSTPEESFALARNIASRNWEAERTRIELLNESLVDIHTGDSDWDTTFALAQKTAFSLFLGPNDHLPYSSFVNARRSDHGYSLRGDGSDYGYLWNGQTPLDSHWLVGIILPSAPELAKGLLRNFLFTQLENGVIDWKPGLGGQRGNRMATPILATLAWQIYQADEDLAFLEEVYAPLLDYLHAWFVAERDRDGDGIPEWDHPMQAGFDDHPLFARWHSWAQGVDITTTESPALCAFLYRECQTLIRMSRILERSEPLPSINTLADHLKVAVDSSWDEASATYRYWDRDTHHNTPSEVLGERQGYGEIQIQQSFEQPIRLLLQVRAGGETTRRSQVFVHGVSPSGAHRVERISADRFQWYLGWGTATSERAYTSVEHVEIQGLDNTDLVTLHSAGLDSEDHTLLLPLWAGIPSAQRANQLIEKTIADPDRYWQPFGLTACPQPLPGLEAITCQSVHIIWNSYIGEGMVAYGYQEDAAELVTRLMKAIVQNLKTEGGFRRYYHAKTGEGMGERDALGGLAPVGLFLEVLGVRLISSHRVVVTGFNPFPWPVTIKYRGLTVLRQKDKTLVIFPDGQTVTVNDPDPRLISLE